MPTPKYIDSPHTVQTSLYGYDRNKKIQFQVNNLRGKDIVVLRGEKACGPPSKPGLEAQKPPESRFLRKWVDRSNQIPAPKPHYPSYTHFHHQYSCTKQQQQQQSPTALSLPNSPKLFDSNKNSRSSGRCLPPMSPSKMTPEEEICVKRLFEKLEIPSSPTSNCSFPNVSSEITHLELNPKIATKSFVTTPSTIAASTSEASSYSTGYVSKTDSRTTSCSSGCGDDTSEDVEEIQKDSGEEDHEMEEKMHTCPDEIQCAIFRNGICVDEVAERNVMLKWYDDLIQWRHDIITRRCFGPPRCHPPPLTITMIGASRAQRLNPFERIGDIHPFAMEAMDAVRRRMDAKRPQRLIPADLPLPAPHEFIANAKSLEPHLFVEYCYQLTAAAYLDTGLTPPHRNPPIPPRMDPMPEQNSRESICSSASEISSDGEYSDDSDDTRQERLRQKMERHRKREHRLQRIFRRRQTLAEIDEEDD